MFYQDSFDLLVNHPLWGSSIRVFRYGHLWFVKRVANEGQKFLTKSGLSSCCPVNLTFPELVGKMGKQLVTEARMKLKVLGLSRYETDSAGMKRIMVPKKSRFSFFWRRGGVGWNQGLIINTKKPSMDLWTKLRADMAQRMVAFPVESEARPPVLVDLVEDCAASRLLLLHLALSNIHQV